MKISNIKIENFRGISAKSIALNDLTIILDDCGKGKSSILSAIIFALTGEVDVTDIRNGCIDTTVLLEFEDGSTVERSRDKTGTTVKVNGKRSTATAAKEYLSSLIGGNVEFLPALLGVDFFGSINQRDLSNLFSKVLPCSITFDKMIEVINMEIRKDTAAYLKDEEVEFLRKYFDTTTPFGIEEIDGAYKKAFDDRKAKKAVLNNLLPKAEFNETLPAESKEELEKALSCIAEKEVLIKTFEKALTAYEKAVKEKEEANASKANIEDALKEYSDVKTPEESVLIKAKEDKKKFEKAIEQSRNIKATAEANIKSFQNILDNLNSDHCVACKDIVCTTDKSCAKTDLEARIADNKKLADEHATFIKRCEEQIAKRDKTIEEYNANALKFEKKTSLEKQLKAIKIPEIPEKPEKPEEFNAEAEKKAINDKLSIISQYNNALTNKAEADAVRKEVNLLEMAVSVLDVKNGVRTVILQKALGTFEKLCNAKISSINSDMEISFKADNGIEVFVKTENSNGFIPMQKASTGQFVLVAFALMCLIGKVTKCNYCIIDNLDKLDKKNAEAFLDLISKDDTFDTVVMAGVSHDDLAEVCKNFNVITL